jgi:uncharacterized protein with von Willebrand factor type A (vWA) domain
MILTLDDLANIRDALNEKIHSLVMAGAKNGGVLAPFSEATRLAETRDKIQAEINKRARKLAP